MNSVSHVSGRMLTADGRGVPKAFLDLDGSARFGWREHDVRNSTQTDAEGYFSFDSVYPGHYFLYNDFLMDDTFGLPAPKTYFPGSRDRRQSQQLIIEESRSLENVVFQLPEFGKPRRIQVLVVDQDDTPVPGAP